MKSQVGSRLEDVKQWSVKGSNKLLQQKVDSKRVREESKE